MVERGEFSVQLMWSPAPSSLIQPVAGYYLELSYQEERGTVTSTRAIPTETPHYLADGLVPGVTYSLALRSSNLAGLSPPPQPALSLHCSSLRQSHWGTAAPSHCSGDSTILEDTLLTPSPSR